MIGLLLFAALAPGNLTIDYPEPGTIFPPDFAAPTFLWHDSNPRAASWRVEISFPDSASILRSIAPGLRMRIGNIDPDCVAPTNELPRLSPEQKSARTWKPNAALWATIRKHRAATVTIRGIAGTRVVSSGLVTFEISKDPVGAPIFYRDVPLMPSETQTGVIKPLASEAVRLIAWRLRYAGESRSRVLLDGLPLCANCHSFSSNGKTLGMDMDGLQNNRGMYTMTPVSRATEIREEDLIQWSTAAGPIKGNLRIGFMSRVSPDGEYVVTTIDPGHDSRSSNYYVANFTDYRFLQVFYPTRGILAWYSRHTGMLQPLPGADDPESVQMGGVWSPDGRYLVFARARAVDPNPPGVPAARFANDPNEAQVRYDLYRIPFNGGLGGRPEPIGGASANGMSNSFPKISPDGRWIVFVKARNGLLMRPDSELHIVAAAGGEARKLRCNRAPMNSWHSFSPNGRWLVFSSKRDSPYTRMYLTHIDESGNDSPAILIENATAANRAVNLPEFVNIAPGDMASLGGPVVEFFKRFDRASYLERKGRYDEAARTWKEVVAIRPDDPMSREHLGVTLMRSGRREEGMQHIRKARDLKLAKAIRAAPGNAELHARRGAALLDAGEAQAAVNELELAVRLDNRSATANANLGRALVALCRVEEGVPYLSRALELDPRSPAARTAMGDAMAARGDKRTAMEHWREPIRHWPDYVPALRRLAWALATSADASVRDGEEAVELALRALQATAGGDTAVLDTLAAAYAEAGRFDAAIVSARRAHAMAAPDRAVQIAARIEMYQSSRPFRDVQAACQAAPATRGR